MDVQKANRWWQKAMAKHELRESHHPTPRKHAAIPTKDKSVMPTDGRKRQRWQMTPNP